MNHITVLCVGKLKEKFFTDACKEYAKRLTAFCKLNIVEIDEEKCPGNPSEKDIERVLQKEGERILSKIPPRAFVAAFCIEGKAMSSPDLAVFLEQLPYTGDGHGVFIIGGSFGLSDAVKNRADKKLSVSPMTFPHQLFRVMVLEQIYRGFQIATGGKYHK